MRTSDFEIAQMKKLIVALLAFGLWGCAHKPPELKGAVNPDKLPVYPNCQDDPNQALAGADLDNAYYDKYWEFTTKDKPDQVMAFYKKAWPGAKEVKEDDYTELLYTFPGAENGEYMTARVRPDGRIHLGECLKVPKHKKAAGEL